jgi:two-component system chemotaxis response regulator CheY
METRALRILVVDDDPLALRATARVLRDHDVITAESFEQALAELQSARFDVVVSDFDMPDVDGAELLAHVSRFFRGAYRILVTGTEPDRVDAFRTTGVADLVLDKRSLRQLAWVCASIRGTR